MGLTLRKLKRLSFTIMTLLCASGFAVSIGGIVPDVNLLDVKPMDSSSYNGTACLVGVPSVFLKVYDAEIMHNMNALNTR